MLRFIAVNVLHKHRFFQRLQVEFRFALELHDARLAVVWEVIHQVVHQSITIFGWQKSRVEHCCPALLTERRAFVHAIDRERPRVSVLGFPSTRIRTWNVVRKELDRVTTVTGSLKGIATGTRRINFLIGRDVSVGIVYTANIIRHRANVLE